MWCVVCQVLGAVGNSCTIYRRCRRVHNSKKLVSTCVCVVRVRTKRALFFVLCQHLIWYRMARGGGGSSCACTLQRSVAALNPPLCLYSTAVPRGRPADFGAVARPSIGAKKMATAFHRHRASCQNIDEGWKGGRSICGRQADECVIFMTDGCTSQLQAVSCVRMT